MLWWLTQENFCDQVVKVVKKKKFSNGKESRTKIKFEDWDTADQQLVSFVLSAQLCRDLYMHTLDLIRVSLRKKTVLTIFNYSIIYLAKLSASFIRKKITNCLSRTKAKHISSRPGISFHRCHSVNPTVNFIPVFISLQSMIE